MIWSNDLTDAQLRLVGLSGYDRNDGRGFGVELRGAQWKTARSLVQKGLGVIDGEGGPFSALYFNNADGAALAHECDDDWEDHCADQSCDICPRVS